jgi:hypothetical protein
MGENMRTSILAGVLLIFGSVAHEAAAQSGEVHCPAKGTQLTFSDAERIEAVSDEGNYVCRFKSLSTEKKFDRLFGVFLPTGPNADQIRSLAPFEVGRKISFTNSGADVRGGDGFWFHDIVIERFENVVTDAGTFPSFVILEDDREMLSSHGEWQRRYWYAPDVGFVVKFEYLTLRGSPPPNYPKNWELTAYRPGPPQPGVARPAPPPPPPVPPPPQAVAQPTSKPVQTVVSSAQPAAERSKVAATAAVPSVPAAVDGIYAGRLAFHIYSAQSAIADIRVSLAGGHATGTITYTSQTFALGSGSLSLDLSPSGDVTGTGQSQDGFGTKLFTIGGHVSGGQIALEISGLSRQSVSTTLSKAE